MKNSMSALGPKDIKLIGEKDNCIFMIMYWHKEYHRKRKVR